MSSSVRLSVCCLSVCRLSITFVHPTQPIEIFGNVSAPCNTLVTWRHPDKILRRSSQGNPSVGGLNQRVVEKKAILDLCEAISRKRCKKRGKLLLITNRKSHMSFRLALSSVTLNDLKRRNTQPHRTVLCYFVLPSRSGSRTLGIKDTFY